MCSEILIILIWLSAIAFAIYFYAQRKNEKTVTFEINRKRSLISGLIILSATVFVIICTIGTDDDLMIYLKDFALVIGSFLGGSILSQGLQNRINN